MAQRRGLGGWLLIATKSMKTNKELLKRVIKMEVRLDEV